MVLSGNKDTVVVEYCSCSCEGTSADLAVFIVDVVSSSTYSF